MSLLFYFQSKLAATSKKTMLYRPDFIGYFLLDDIYGFTIYHYDGDKLLVNGRERKKFANRSNILAIDMS